MSCGVWLPLRVEALLSGGGVWVPPKNLAEGKVVVRVRELRFCGRDLVHEQRHLRLRQQPKRVAGIGFSGCKGAAVTLEAANQAHGASGGEKTGARIAPSSGFCSRLVACFASSSFGTATAFRAAPRWDHACGYRSNSEPAALQPAPLSGTHIVAGLVGLGRNARQVERCFSHGDEAAKHRPTSHS
jgi:hypothetical protein